MKILITGGCGFLGSNIAAKYLKAGDQVFILDSLFRTGTEENLKWLMSLASEDQLIFMKLDLANRKMLKIF